MIRKISVFLLLLALLTPVCAFARKGHMSHPPKAVKYSVKKVKKHRRVKRVRRTKQRHPKVVTLVQPADRAAV